MKNKERKRLLLVSKALKANQPKGRQTTRGKRTLETAGGTKNRIKLAEKNPESGSDMKIITRHKMGNVKR